MATMKGPWLLVLALVGIVVGVGVVSDRASGMTTSVAVQRGLVLPTWERNGYSETDTRGALHAIASVGADWVQIVPTWYQSTRSASDIGPTDASVTDDDVRYAVGLARANGLKVLLKPHVDLLDGGDRTQIDPADRRTWFQSYHGFIDHYASLAQQNSVDEFAVGTELKALSSDRTQWLAVVQDVRGRYHGPLTYAAHHSEYPTVAFWDAVDLVGVDAYWPLSSHPTADVSQLEAAFAPIRDDLAAFAARVGRPILFTEAGFPSQAGSVTAPWDVRLSDQPADDEQASAYEALLATFTGQPWWAGVFWWVWTIQHTSRIDPRSELDHSVEGKPAESVLRQWWSSRADDKTPSTRSRPTPSLLERTAQQGR
ncbi:MAG: hypothetical protein JWR11_2877 [Mycobacterium sp.]|jgi:hypothetical protein|nr:hypothetical protein [Mycobacterium sp.]MDT5068015.1 hypothetical protein [Mycobacterium sp.]